MFGGEGLGSGFFLAPVFIYPKNLIGAFPAKLYSGVDASRRLNSFLCISHPQNFDPFFPVGTPPRFKLICRPIDSRGVVIPFSFQGPEQGPVSV